MESTVGGAVENGSKGGAAQPPPGIATEVSAIAGQSAASQSPSDDEQMALFEKELKENDWGHQPC